MNQMYLVLHVLALKLLVIIMIITTAMVMEQMELVVEE